MVLCLTNSEAIRSTSGQCSFKMLSAMGIALSIISSPNRSTSGGYGFGMVQIAGRELLEIVGSERIIAAPMGQHSPGYGEATRCIFARAFSIRDAFYLFRHRTRKAYRSVL